MVYYVITGRGDQGADGATIRDLFVNGPGNPTGTGTGPAVNSFTLVNADTDQDIGPLSNGATVNLAALPTRNLNVRANTSPVTVGSVRFGLDGVASYRIENSGPYALAGDTGGNYSAWTPSVGSHSLVATAFDAAGATGGSGAPLSLSFTVADSAALKAAFVEDVRPTDGGGTSCGLLGLEGAVLLALVRRRRR
jgi:MYXO-CTERM domain-containing protein